jgi:hypothetical protein
VKGRFMASLPNSPLRLMITGRTAVRPAERKTDDRTRRVRT